MTVVITIDDHEDDDGVDVTVGFRDDGGEHHQVDSCHLAGRQLTLQSFRASSKSVEH